VKPLILFGESDVGAGEGNRTLVIITKADPRKCAIFSLGFRRNYATGHHCLELGVTRQSSGSAGQNGDGRFDITHRSKRATLMARQ
jgi:hypothetical protein